MEDGAEPELWLKSLCLPCRVWLMAPQASSSRGNKIWGHKSDLILGFGRCSGLLIGRRHLQGSQCPFYTPSCNGVPSWKESICKHTICCVVTHCELLDLLFLLCEAVIRLSISSSISPSYLVEHHWSLFLTNQTTFKILFRMKLAFRFRWAAFSDRICVFNI